MMMMMMTMVMRNLHSNFVRCKLCGLCLDEHVSDSSSVRWSRVFCNLSVPWRYQLDTRWRQGLAGIEWCSWSSGVRRGRQLALLHAAWLRHAASHSARQVDTASLRPFHIRSSPHDTTCCSLPYNKCYGEITLKSHSATENGMWPHCRPEPYF